MSVDTESTAPAPIEGASPDRKRQGQGQLLRRIWRYHFYAALISAPFLVLLAITGLVILYTQPISDFIHRDLVTVQQGTSTVSLDAQRDAAAKVFPDYTVDFVIPPTAPDRSTLVDLSDGDSIYQQVYVNPYTGKVIGSMRAGDDVVGLANRLHGFLNSDAWMVSLPSLSHYIDESNPATVNIKVAELVLEVIAIWGLVLALTGLYLWWPRRSQKSKRLFSVRWSKGGRLRWQDMHTMSGISLCAILIVFIVTGMPWSDYWGIDWSTVASKVTPNQEFTEPTSTAVKAGTFDRFGHRIPWATREDVIPASPTKGAVPSVLALDDVVKIAGQEGFAPGFIITMPINDSSDAANPVYGTYQVSTPWPIREQDEAVVYLDQFTGQTAGRSSPAQWGALTYATEFGVQNHMGTQFGLLSRIAMTLGCLLVIFSFISAFMLWWLRRPKGTAGLPKHPQGARPVWWVVVIAVVLAVIYPIWGASLIVVLAFDGVVQLVRRVRA